MHAKQIKIDYKQLLSRLCHLVALSEVKKIEGVVDSLVTSIIESDLNNPANNITMVDEALKTFYGIQLDLKDIESSVNRLFGSGTLVSGARRGAFTMSPAGRAAQLKRVEDASKLEETVRAQWIASIQGQFDSWSKQTEIELWASLKAYLTRLFRRHGAQTAQIISNKSIPDAELEMSVGQLINDALDKECTTVDRGQAANAIQTFLREQTAERAQYIAQLLDGTFSFYALFTDEATQNYLKATIPRITVLMDTNFLFGVLNLHNNPQNQVSRELVSLIREQNLPFELYYHEESLKEMRETIALTERNLRRQRWPAALSRAALQSRPQDFTGLEMKFHEANAKHDIEPGAYFLKWRHIDKVLNAEGFKIYRRSEPATYDDNDNEVLDEKTLNLISDYRRFLDEHWPNNRQKGFNTVKHDIIVWRTTKALRKKEASGLDVGAFMLSADQHLYTFDWGVLGEKNGFGVVVLPSQLIQLLRPFVPKTIDFDKKFAEVFALPEFRVGGQEFSQITHRVLGFLASVKDLSEETATAILADELLLKRLKGVELDTEVQAAIESEVLKKNAELAKKHSYVTAQLEAVINDSIAKQGVLEATQQDAIAQEKIAADLAMKLEKEKADKKQSDALAAAAEADASRTKAALAAALGEKTRLAGEIEHTRETISGLQKKLSELEADKAYSRKVLRVVGGAIFTLAGWASVFWLPVVRNWQWLQSHQHKDSLYLAALVLIVGLAWGLFSWKHRAWGWSALVLAVLIRLIGVL